MDPANNPTPPEYEGMPIQYLGDKQSWYTDLIDGCVQHYGERGSRCLQNEIDRVDMSLRQPQSMYNYTKMGFTKIRAPDSVMKLIKEFWNINKDKAKPENWPAGNTYTNHWKAPSKMVSVEDKSFQGGGFVLKQQIWNAARDTISVRSLCSSVRNPV
jgi:prolyl 4-hydroxylase